MIGWLDCASGASGDMILGALAGAGVPMSVLTEAVSAVAPEPIRLVHEQVSRSGFAATRVHVDAAESDSGRTWADIEILLAQAPLADPVRQRAASTFARLAEAEGRVHGLPATEVHFHEVGALDAIADIVGCCAGFDDLGLSRLVATPVALGGGSVRTLHGTISVPAPAVTALLAGVPTYGGGVDAELCTPTGAALLAEWVDDWGDHPAMSVSSAGVGAGGRDIAGRPNVLRLLVGRPGEAGDESTEAALMIETNIDDLDPRLWPAVISRLLAAGASDAWLTPVSMKKGRPAHTLHALVPGDRAEAVRALVFTETTAIGVREYPVAKRPLDRHEATVELAGRSVRIKLATYRGAIVNAQPEYEDVAAVADETGQPVKAVLAQAVAAARSLW
jgi:pyridinium-3,5-bisthiocarboxylic acid mononucleotide nickel chelatase